jgi:hypothetical protein
MKLIIGLPAGVGDPSHAQQQFVTKCFGRSYCNEETVHYISPEYLLSGFA